MWVRGTDIHTDMDPVYLQLRVGLVYLIHRWIWCTYTHSEMDLVHLH